MATIVLDPGHGGHERLGGSSPNNAVGPTGVLEKDLTLAVCKSAQAVLQERGRRAILTRASDRNLSLKARAHVARQSSAEVFVSVHFNGWPDPRTQGTETHVHKRAGAAARGLAREVQTALVRATQLRDRGVKDEYALGVLAPEQHDAVTAACLVEISFLTDPAEETRLKQQTYLDAVAVALADGCEAYLNATSDSERAAFASEAAMVRPAGKSEQAWEDAAAINAAAPGAAGVARNATRTARSDTGVAPRVTLEDLEARIEAAAANDDVEALERLGIYFEATGASPRPFAHDVAASSLLVEGADVRGDKAMQLANKLSRAIRAGKYRRRIAGGYVGPILVSEGDSWFQYPLLLKDVIDHLIDDYAVWSLDAAGDEMADIVSQAEYKKAIARERANVFLISGGGNDLCGGGDLDSILGPYPADGDIDRMFRTEAFERKIGALRASYAAMYEDLLNSFPDLTIVSHCYDYALPRGDGPWLGPPLARLGVPLDLQPRVIRALIDAFARIQRDLAAVHAGRVRFVDCRNVVVSDWHDELHPTNAGFRRVGKRFKQAVAEALGRGAEEARSAGEGRADASEPTIRITRGGRFVEETGQGLARALEDLTTAKARTLHLHFHGGLIEQEKGVAIARRLAREDGLGGAGRRQVFHVWSSGVLEVLQTNFLEILEKAFLLRLLRHIAEWVADRLDYFGEDLRSAPSKAAAIGEDLVRLDALLSGGAAPLTGSVGEPFAQFGGVPDDARAGDPSSLEAAILGDGVLSAVTESLAAELSGARRMGSGLADADNEARWLLEKLDADVRGELSRTLAGAGARGGGSFFAAKAIAIGRAVLKRFAHGRAHGVWPTVVEELARALFVENLGGAVWGAMKGDAGDAFGAGGDGLALLDAIAKARQAPGAKAFEVAITAHSAGAVLACRLLQAAARDPALADLRWNVTLLAPACDYALFAETLDIAETNIARFRMFTMTDDAERSDPVLGVFNPRLAPLYPRSLLYLVSGLFEQGEVDDPILGMARFHGVDGKRRYTQKEEGAIKRVNSYLFDLAAPVRVVLTPTSQDAPLGFRSLARAHTSFDTEPATLASVREILAGGGRTPQEAAVARVAVMKSADAQMACAPVRGRDPKVIAGDQLEGVRVLDGVLPFTAASGKDERKYLADAAHALRSDDVDMADADAQRALGRALKSEFFDRTAIIREIAQSEALTAQLGALADAGVGFFRATDAYAARSLSQRLEVGGSGEVTRVMTNGVEVLLETERLVVSFEPDMSDELRAALMQRLEFYELREIGRLTGRTFHCGSSKPSTDLCRRLIGEPGVLYAQPDYIRHIGTRSLPGDAILANQWHHGRVSSMSGWSAGFTGQGVKLAVIDNGFDAGHPDLRFDAGYSAWFNDAGTVGDPNFVRGVSGMPDKDHGTACAGMAASAQVSGNGVGLAYDVSLRGIACLSDQVGTQTTLARALLFAANPRYEIEGGDGANGADVIVCSLGPSRDARWVATPLLLDAIETIVNGGRGGKGAPVFWAVTNGKHPIRLDEVCSSAFVIPVGRSTSADDDHGSGYGPELDFLAPGVDVYIPQSGGAYQSTTGTSFAAPCAAGVAALLLQVAPHLTGAQVRQVLRRSCDAVGVYPYENKRNNYYGYGRINAARAISLAKQM